MKKISLSSLILFFIVFSVNFAAAVAPTSDEMAKSREWAATRFEGGKEAKEIEPCFSFTYDGKPSAELLKTWELKKSAKQLDDKRKQYTLAFTDPKTGLELRCVGVEYLDFPTVEWTLFFKNTSNKDTPILSDLQALDIKVERPVGPSSTETEFLLHHQKGAPVSINDFQPFETLLAPNLVKQFSGDGGRPTGKDYPYYNLEFPGGQGMIVVVSWPGQWASAFLRDKENHLQIRAGQELTHFKLLPGEEVRTPMIVLQFWKGGDWIRSQNIWRRWMVAHNMPRPGGKLPAPQLNACSSQQFEEMYKADTASQKSFIDRWIEEKIIPDFWWMDAGWYPCDPVGWGKTGSWEVDTRRFPKGLREVSDHAHAKGIKTIVWFEPERTAAGTWLPENHPEWIHGGKNGGLLDLGNPDAWNWLAKHVNKLIDDQGIDLYRQDFNMQPLSFWRSADAEDRQGITEIKHVVGYLAYWDDLIKHHPNLLIDTCASGGNRNDLETLRRAIPLWREDYILEPVGCQGITYGMSLWLPYQGTGANSTDPYLLRSAFCASFNALYDVRRKDIDYDILRREIGFWRQYAPNFLGDFYPLTPYNVDAKSWIAWQFNTPEKGEGVVQAFRRDQSPYESIRVKLHDLNPDATYALTNLDNSNVTEITGRELIENGIPVSIKDQPGSAIITYKKKT